MKAAKKFLLTFTVIFTLSTCFLSHYYSMDHKITSEKFQPINEEKCMENIPLIKPKSSTVTKEITKIGGILDGTVEDVMIVGSLAFIANGWGGLKIIDISDPTNPIKVGQFKDGGDANGVYVSGSYAYVANEFDGLEIIDISNPTNPGKVGQCDGAGEDVYVSGSYAYVAEWNNGLGIIDISDPTNPMKVGQFHEGDSTKDVFVSGSYVYLASNWNGLEILQVSEVENTISITNPNSSSSWEQNSSQDILWEWTGYIPTVNFDVLRDEEIVLTIEAGYYNDGSYNWTLPIELGNSKNYQIKVIDASDNSTYGLSEIFEIASGFSISSYNPILLLVSMVGISVILVRRRRREN